MISFIVRQSIRYPGVVVALALTVVVYGLYVLSLANLDVFPEFSPSQVVIQTEAPGLSAELVERQVSQPIESVLAGASGVEHIRSQSIPGLSVVTVLFREGSSAYRNRQVVSERLASLANQLPHGVAQPAMTPLTSSASTVLGVGTHLEARRSLMEIRTLVDWTVRPHLLAVEGVAEVNVFGGEVRQWQVQVDPEKLMRYGLSMQEVVQAARRATGVLAGRIRAHRQPAPHRERGSAAALGRRPGARDADAEGGAGAAAGRCGQGDSRRRPHPSAPRRSTASPVCSSWCRASSAPTRAR